MAWHYFMEALWFCAALPSFACTRFDPQKNKTNSLTFISKLSVHRLIQFNKTVSLVSRILSLSLNHVLSSYLLHLSIPLPIQFRPHMCVCMYVRIYAYMRLYVCSAVCCGVVCCVVQFSHVSTTRLTNLGYT